MMNQNKIAISMLFVIVVLGGCSSQEVQQDADVLKVIPETASTDAESRKDDSNTAQVSVDALTNKKNSGVETAEKNAQEKINKKRRDALKIERKRVAKKRYPQNTPSPRIRKVPWVSSRPYSLVGDFSSNKAAQRFINNMSRSYGIDRNYLNRMFSQARNLKKIYTPPKKSRKRHGKVGRWTRYRNFFIRPRHINAGVKFWQQNAATLNRAYRQYGVPPEYIIGILGVETIYGGNVGKTRVIDALATKAFHSGRRQKFFRTELKRFLLMAKSEGLNPITLKGSSAGAIGLCQFMPSNFKPFGVDFDRNGSCNLWNPQDAIGSVANYFKKHNWRKGGPVVVRASVTGNAYKRLKSGYKKKYSLARLKRNGIQPLGRIDNTVRFLRMSTYAGDEVWLGGHNYYVITRYNHDARYALAVHQLGQEVKKRYLASRRGVARK